MLQPLANIIINNNNNNNSDDDNMNTSNTKNISNHNNNTYKVKPELFYWLQLFKIIKENITLT